MNISACGRYPQTNQQHGQRRGHDHEFEEDCQPPATHSSSLRKRPNQDVGKNSETRPIASRGHGEVHHGRSFSHVRF